MYRTELCKPLEYCAWRESPIVIGECTRPRSSDPFELGGDLRKANDGSKRGVEAKVLLRSLRCVARRSRCERKRKPGYFGRDDTQRIGELRQGAAPIETGELRSKCC